MEPLLPVQVTPDLRSGASAMIERLSAWGPPALAAADGWLPFAEALDLGGAASSAGSGVGDGRVVVAVGPIATAVGALDEAATAGVIGFIAPAAFRRRWWQREATVFLDPTIDVWAAGWTPIAVDRIDVAGTDATIEVVVGHARPTPARPPTSALDDAD